MLGDIIVINMQMMSCDLSFHHKNVIILNLYMDMVVDITLLSSTNLNDSYVYLFRL